MMRGWIIEPNLDYPGPEYKKGRQNTVKPALNKWAWDEMRPCPGRGRPPREWPERPVASFRGNGAFAGRRREGHAGHLVAGQGLGDEAAGFHAFDEFVQLKDQQKEFFTSPQMKKKPQLSIRGRGILIQIKDTLKENTTYALNFGSAVRDNNEGNPLYSMRYVFSTGPEIRSPLWNVVTEAIGTFVLVFVVLAAGHWGDSNTHTPAGLGWLGALGVALLVVVIGTGLGGPTGYAINPARDLGPRIAHAVLPIPNKGSSDWGYAWVPVVGPIIGGVLAGVSSGFLLPA